MGHWIHRGWASQADCCPLLPVLQLTYLPPPWGECRSSEMGLDFFPVYSITACRIDCETRYIVENCNCRMVHMPGQCQGRGGHRAPPGTTWDLLCISQPDGKHLANSTSIQRGTILGRLLFGTQTFRGHRETSTLATKTGPWCPEVSTGLETVPPNVQHVCQLFAVSGYLDACNCCILMWCMFTHPDVCCFRPDVSFLASKCPALFQMRQSPSASK